MTENGYSITEFYKNNADNKEMMRDAKFIDNKCREKQELSESGPAQKISFLKRINTYKKNDFIQYSNFYEIDLSTNEFYTIMLDLEENHLVEKIFEIYSPYSHHSTGYTLDEINIKDEIYCEETDETFTVNPDNIKVKFKVIV
ncbi:hypothetical protein [Staphylococcus pseudintermedius]|uniref:hypothetical protein n=7 Tax=Staphylococcus pseudintermedius TaxID=283734 RepID=UPI001BDF3DC4|nr:hypothetical protein [Staphylococcus pseudintermedius]